ncbi:efflux RND transporter permease subunit [Congregibacter litoralis]|uniref:Putative exporter of the RND superfamily n=1 Tax=Congregibacter litoralis KT71 TaxID=314285 RepID=A4A828_9GAMM|nr:MMPL family transporter [Congregibacter litoralis]EAQ97823.1 putative exporter of the RND superfamily [Congregibacter litoralis KT71]
MTVQESYTLDDSDGRIRPAIGRVIFAARVPLIALFVIATGFFGWKLTQLRADASFEKMIPVSHPYVQNFLASRDDLKGLGNSVRIIVETRDGDIFTESFQTLLQRITDEVFYINGVDRSALQSLWTPNVRWQEVTEEGFVGGSVIPDDYDGSPRTLSKLRENTLKSGQIGRLVANNFRSAIVVVPLVEIDPSTGERLDYATFSRDLETLVREKYESDEISIRIIGFAKLIGDLIEGAALVGLFFLVAFVITAILLFLYTRCLWLSFASLLCSTVAVVWQMGLLKVMGMGLDPYSMLVPFLVFAVGISHSVQIVNRFGHFIYHRVSRVDAARLTFVRLSKPGFIALVSDGVGFFTLRVIDIPVIQELAVVASTGIAVLVLTNLILLPLVLSFTGVSDRCVRYRADKDHSEYRHWRFLSGVTRRGPATAVVLVCLSLFAVGIWFGQDQQIGDLDPGAPELRADSRYNIDNAFLTENYSTSTDVFVVMARTREQQCGSYDFIAAVDRFQRQMEAVPGVQSALSLVDVSKLVIQGMNEGSPKWHDISRNQYVLNNSLSRAPNSLRNTDCSMAPVILFLDDHKAETLNSVVDAAELLAPRYESEDLQFQLAAGNAGVEAATNIVIADAQAKMLLWVYGVVILLCLLNFRSVRVTVCIIVPLALTSVLAQALMAALGIGVKVATLPVIALGVGIGVDYGIYIYSALQFYLHRGEPLTVAYFEALKSSGTAVAFTGLTLAIGVGTWIYSPIKFQADMGLMLTFMFFWNMLGALIFLPALTVFFYSREERSGNPTVGKPG